MNFQREMDFAGVRVIQDNFKQWRGCELKRRHATELAAKNARAAMRDRGVEGLTSYFCENCFGWHNGHGRKK